MLLEIVNAVAPAFTAISAARDSGMWFVQMNGHIFNNYMESFMGERGLLP